MSGLGDKPEGSTVLPVPTGDTELLGHSRDSLSPCRWSPASGEGGKMAAEADAGDPGDPHSRKATPCAPSLLFSTSNVKLFLILFVDTKKIGKLFICLYP